MAVTHRLESTVSPAGILFECQDGCNRRLVVDRGDGRLIVIDRGDPLALHSGSTGAVALAMPAVTSE